MKALSETIAFWGSPADLYWRDFQVVQLLSPQEIYNAGMVLGYS